MVTFEGKRNGKWLVRESDPGILLEFKGKNANKFTQVDKPRIAREMVRFSLTVKDIEKLLGARMETLATATMENFVTVHNDGELAIQILTYSDGTDSLGCIQRTHVLDGRAIQQSSRSEFLRDLPVNKPFLAFAKREGWISDIEAAVREHCCLKTVQVFMTNTNTKEGLMLKAIAISQKGSSRNMQRPQQLHGKKPWTQGESNVLVRYL
jgi:hypothetical protein